MYQICARDCDILNADIPFDMDKCISQIIEKYKSEMGYQLESILNYFKLFQIDPLSFIRGGKKIYFHDRCESYSSLISLICMYYIFCNEQHLSDEQKMIVYNNLKFIGFDVKSNSKIEKDGLIIERINQFMYQMFTKQSNLIVKSDYHFIQQNYPKGEDQRSNCIADNFGIFDSQQDLINKLIVFLTLSESTYNNGRCIKSCALVDRNMCQHKIMDDYVRNNNTFKLKASSPESDNCNLINLFLMICINNLSLEYISNMIENLDAIKTDLLFKNNIDFTPINRKYVDYSTTNYKRNIFYNILINKHIIHDLKTDIKMLSSNLIYGNCDYELPL